MAGFFVIERSIFENDQFRDQRDRYAAIWLIAHAAWKEAWHKVGKNSRRVERGQGFWSLRFLGQAWGMSDKGTRGIIAHLQKTGFLDAASDAHGTLITVLKYNDYQGDGRAQDADADAHWTRTGRALDANKKEEKKERRNEEGGDFAAAVDAWNDVASKLGLAKVQKPTSARRRSVAARLKDCGGVDGWRQALAKLEASPFLRGENDRGWRPDFDWLLSETNFTKLMEGKYDPRSGGAKPASRRDAASVGAEFLARHQNSGDGPDRQGWPVRDWPDDGGPGAGGGPAGHPQHGGGGMSPGAAAGHGGGFDQTCSGDGAPVSVDGGNIVSLRRSAGGISG